MGIFLQLPKPEEGGVASLLGIPEGTQLSATLPQSQLTLEQSSPAPGDLAMAPSSWGSERVFQGLGPPWERAPKVVVGAVSLFSGAPGKGLESQQVEFPKTALGSGIFSQPSQCGFKWETQAFQDRACSGCPSPPPLQNPPWSLLSARQTCDYIYFTGLGGLIVTAPLLPAGVT